MSKRNNVTLIHSDSGEVEYYTPPFIIEAAREVMGGIELDPASSPLANEVVAAERFFTEEDDAFTKRWEAATVWMNHPFSRQNNAKWIAKLVDHFDRGDIDEAMCITFASTSEKWFLPLMKFPQCYLTPRTKYYRHGLPTKGVSKGSVVTYLSEAPRRRLNKFYEQFKDLGNVMIPYSLVNVSP